jgi:hypothetical protein
MPRWRVDLIRRPRESFKSRPLGRNKVVDKKIDPERNL